MKIIYVHHAERNVSKDHLNSELRQLEDITETGIKEAEFLAERLKKQKVKAIVTSPYLRCKHTSEILNKYINVPIIEDSRFNEIKTYKDDDTIICVTSGVNVSAFICYFYKIEPTNETPWSQAAGLSPMIFTIGKKMLD